MATYQAMEKVLLRQSFGVDAGGVTTGECVTINAASQLVQDAAALGASAIGIAEKTVTAAEVAASAETLFVGVALLGIKLATAEDAAIVAGDRLTPAATGRVVTVTSALSNTPLIGTALAASNAAGDEIPVLLGGPSQVNDGVA